MGFFFCPRLRYRKPSDSSDLTDSYHLDRIESSSTINVHPEGVSSSVDEQTYFDRHSASSGGLSHKIRRRFSRDARDLYRRPQRSDRSPKVPFLRFASKHSGAHPAPIASHDVGSSLMSERGYDSDAQYIATPKHPTYNTEYQANKPRNGIAMSPRRPPPASALREPDTEPSRDQPTGLIVDNRNISTEQLPYLGEGAEPQLSWRSRDHEHRVPQTFPESPSSFHVVDPGTPRSKPASPSPGGRAWAQERPAPAPIPRVQEMHRQHIQAVPGRPPRRVGSSEDNAYAMSADSLVGCPPQISIRKRHQRPRREMTPDEQSVHLAEMNIPKLLASSSSTSNVAPLNHPSDEDQVASNRGMWDASRYQRISKPAAVPNLWDVPEGRPEMQLTGSQDSKPLYPAKTSDSPAGYKYEQNYFHCFQDPSGNMFPIHTRLPFRQTEETRNPEAHNASSPETHAAGIDALKSKFTEKFGSDPSVNRLQVELQRSDGVDHTRKISVGWMSEGRRVGYGYTLVPPDDSREALGQPQLPGSSGSPRDHPHGPLVGNAREYTDDHRIPQTGKTSQGPNKPSESGLDVSAILQKLNLPRWTGAGFGLRTSNSDAGSCDSGGSSIFGILTGKKKNHEGATSSADTDNPWEFCSWVRPVPTLRGQGAPQAETVGSGDYAEAQLIEKLATLRRRGGAWSTKRKVSELARDIEKRADRAVAKLAASTEQFPVVRRTATRVLRLRGPGSKERALRMHDSYPVLSPDQFDGCRGPQNSQVKPSERTSSDGSDSSDWDSLYEECLEEHPIPE
ncbi:hypothetical protein BJX61DRAFT_248250 [Aspergillus egyptiacus]|nr:hypothetical protein BJX61DRAFT_248250 [Aspergillus egyptiacus]